MHGQLGGMLHENHHSIARCRLDRQHVTTAQQSAEPLPVSSTLLQGLTRSHIKKFLQAKQIALRNVQQMFAGPCSPAEGADNDSHRAVACDLCKGIVLLQQVIQRLGLLLSRFGQLCKWQQDVRTTCEIT